MIDARLDQFITQNDVATLIKPVSTAGSVRLSAYAYLFVYDRIVGNERLDQLAADMNCVMSCARCWVSDSTYVHLVPLRQARYPKAAFTITDSNVRAWSFDARHRKPNPFLEFLASTPPLSREEREKRRAAVSQELNWIATRFPGV